MHNGFEKGSLRTEKAEHTRQFFFNLCELKTSIFVSSQTRYIRCVTQSCSHIAINTAFDIWEIYSRRKQ